MFIPRHFINVRPDFNQESRAAPAGDPAPEPSDPEDLCQDLDSNGGQPQAATARGFVPISSNQNRPPQSLDFSTGDEEYFKILQNYLEDPLAFEDDITPSGLHYCLPPYRTLMRVYKNRGQTFSFENANHKYGLRSRQYCSMRCIVDFGGFGMPGKGSYKLASKKMISSYDQPFNGFYKLKGEQAKEKGTMNWQWSEGGEKSYQKALKAWPK